MTTDGSTRKLAVILHADVTGSTALVQRDETLAHERIQNAFRRFSETIRAYGGTPQEVRGDALLATFERTSDAVSASLSFQLVNAQYNEGFEDDIRPEIRVGISIGEVVIADGTLTGPDVVMAQRIEQLAEPGGVCIQGTAYETIPRRLHFEYESLGEQRLKGFDEPVRVYKVESSPGEEIPRPDPQRPAKRLTGGRLLLAISASMIITAGITVWLQPWKPKVEPEHKDNAVVALPEKPSIAVLPFDNLSQDKSQEYFADGMTEDIITDLSKISGLFVIARNSSFAYKGKRFDVKDVGRALGVRFVLEGSVRRAGGEIRVNAQLIDAQTGGHLWADRIDGQIANVFKLQDQITQRIVGALKVRMTVGEQRRLNNAAEVDPQAYDLYLQGQQLHATFKMEDRVEMLKLYGHAVKLDPSFAEAHARLANVAYDVARADHFWILPQKEALALTESHAAKALALEPDNAMALATLAHQALESGQAEKAFDLIERAVAAAPSDVNTLSRQAYILSRGGSYDEAAATADLVLRLEPKPTAAQLMILSNAYLHARKYEKSVTYGEMAKQMGIRPIWALETLVAGYARLGMQTKLQQAKTELLSAWPSVNLRYWREEFDYFRPSATLDHWLDSLRMAGIPEWPMGVLPTLENMLTKTEMTAVFNPDVQRVGVNNYGWRFRSVAGSDESIQETWQSPKGQQFVRTSSITRLILEKDGNHVQEVCSREPDRDMGRERCVLIVRNSAGSKATRDQYLLASIRSLSRFAALPRDEVIDWTKAPE